MGITGAMKIANLAEGFGSDDEFHFAGSAPHHYMATAQNTKLYVILLVHPDSQGTWSLPVLGGYDDSLAAVVADGTVAVPDDFGLGVEYDWDFIVYHRIDE